MNGKTLCAVALALFLPGGGAPADDAEWPSHHHDAGGTRFSPLKQITPGNVATLQPAWTVDTGATNIQVTPSASPLGWQL